MRTLPLDPFDSSTWTEDERYYFETVEEVLEGRENIIISNGKPEHAVYLIHKFLTGAREAVRLFSGRLSRVYEGVLVYDRPEVAEAAQQFLRRGGKLTAIVGAGLDVDEGQSADEHPLVSAAREVQKQGQLRGVLDIRQAPPHALDALRKADYDHHWMTMDADAYRLETDTKRIRAHVNFGDSVMTGRLVTIFDKLLYPGSQELVRVRG